MLSYAGPLIPASQTEPYVLKYKAEIIFLQIKRQDTSVLNFEL